MNTGKNQIAVLAGGCFWCLEAVFEDLKGVISVMPGYAGGRKDEPTYEEVSSGNTGHAEVIKIEFDPSIISYRDLLAIFFDIHDPTSLNRQGNDVGEQYRSAIFWTNEFQKKEAKDFIKELASGGNYEKPIVTEIEPLDKFWTAEEYHKHYFKNNPKEPYCSLVIVPKIKKVREKYAGFLK